MRRVFVYLIFGFLILGLQASTRAQDILVPAGTLLHCTLEEPDFSSATADVNDPVLCHLGSLQEFGHVVFPRGSYLAGHLEAEKEPGHFVGKGYLKLQFDRIGLPSSDIPVPSKVIAARGFRVDRQGDIIGHGHAKRDTVEWLLPPLWPWKILTLPARGPRPTLKGEEQITLRLMDDIIVPRHIAAAQLSERPPSFDRPQSSNMSQSFARPQSFDSPAKNVFGIRYVPPSTPALEDQLEVSAMLPLQPSGPESTSEIKLRPVRQTLIALKSNRIYAVTNYRIDSGRIKDALSSGVTGTVDVSEVDWRKTSVLNSEQNASNRPKTDQHAH